MAEELTPELMAELRVLAPDLANHIRWCESCRESAASDVELLRKAAAKLVEHIESVKPVEARERVVKAGSDATDADPLEALRGPFTGLIGPLGLAPDTEQQRQDYRAAFDTVQARERRLEATDLAIRALKPVAGAYLGVDDYADAIARLADRLGEYIQNGA